MFERAIRFVCWTRVYVLRTRVFVLDARLFVVGRALFCLDARFCDVVVTRIYLFCLTRVYLVVGARCWFLSFRDDLLSKKQTRERPPRRYERPKKKQELRERLSRRS